tara:strand:+ start:991 stop:3354 length:2364 start_codon:yes stop_codon:yes gene_type:complete
MYRIVGSIYLVFLLLLTLGTIGCSQNINDNKTYQTLWYDQPANEWEDALPLGNGRLGVMVFGNPKNERIQLNDDSLWPDNLDWEANHGNSKDLAEIRKLLFDGYSGTADSLWVNRFSNKWVTRSHQTLGDLYMDWEHDSIAGYKRSLDLSSALSRTSYKVEGHQVEQKVFVSHPHQIIVVEVSSNHPDGLNGLIRLNRPEDNGFETVSVRSSQNRIIMSGEVTQRGGRFNSIDTPILSGVKFETQLISQNKGGQIEATDNNLKVSGVKKLTLYISSNSDYYTQDYIKKNSDELARAENSSTQQIEQQHIEAHRSLFNRTQLDLKPDEALALIPTDQRIERIKKGSIDNGLSQILFDYGRYLLICSSRPGTLPANLQGLWNYHIKAPWNADYHLNINLQMNYWLANPTGLHELNEPLFGFIDRLVESGKGTAQNSFGLRGSVIPHASDLWAPTWFRGAQTYWGGFFGAGGWLMQHYWYHYEYTLDKGFLRERAHPAIEQIALFYSDWLVTDPRDNSLVSVPSTSPENKYINSKGQTVGFTIGSAMDQQIIYETFRNYLKASEILQIENELTKKISQQINRLRPGFVVSKAGRVLEWDREYEEFEPGHRHISHLYGFHPGNQVTKGDQPELFEAVRKTLDYKLENGGAGTGWSRAWLINFSARLLDGEMALEHIQLLFQKSIYKNLFDAHPPFQIDGNFGFTAGVAEMLVQSHEKIGIRLLPALPKAWANGQVDGLFARGGIKIAMEWEDSKLKLFTLTSESDQSTSIIYGDKVYQLDLKKGKPTTYRF